MIGVDAKDRFDIQLITGEDKGFALTSSFDNVVGQESVVKKLLFYLNSHKPNMVFPSMLFTGSHGLGKTYIAGLLAEKMSRRFLEVNCGALGSTKDFIEDILLNRIVGMKPVTVLLDEAHRLSNEITTILLSLLATNSRGINVLEYKGYEISYDLTKINTILATTDSFKIFPPLIDRCETIYFKSYNNQELIQMLKFYLPGIEFVDFKDEDFEELAYACRGRGRDAYSLAQKIKRICDGKLQFRKGDWNLIKTIFNIYPMGLNEQEVNLMRIIRIEGIISGANIAARMMIKEDNVADEIEIRPKELWLVSNTPRGRILTDRGEEYFTRLLKESKRDSEVIMKGS